MLNLRLARPMLIALAACAANFFVQGSALADDAQENKALKEQMRQMMQRMDALQKQVEALSKQQAATPPPAVVTAAAAAVRAAAAAVAKTTKERLQSRSSKPFSKVSTAPWTHPSMDTTKGMDGMTAYHYAGAPVNGVYPTTGVKGTPYGPVGWQPSISTNAATLGWRGSHAIPGWDDTKFVIQIEANVGIDRLAGRDDELYGADGRHAGRDRFGHDLSRIRQPELGRAEDRSRHVTVRQFIPAPRPLRRHGRRYERHHEQYRRRQPGRIRHRDGSLDLVRIAEIRPGFSFDLFFSPGQNRTADANLNLAGGSSNCSGGNVPGSGNLLLTCDDGGFDNAYSVDLKFECEHLYLMAAYELHKHVNRNSDGIGSNSPGYANMLNEGDPAAGGGGPLTQYLNWGLFDQVATAYGATGSCTTAPSSATYYCVNATPEFQGDIGDEAALHVGGQYAFDFGLTVNAIFERMTRKLPAALEFQNERQRNGSWLAFTQALSPKDNLNLGWAHAGRTPGDPGGQHNYNPNSTDDTANMYSVGVQAQLGQELVLVCRPGGNHQQRQCALRSGCRRPRHQDRLP